MTSTPMMIDVDTGIDDAVALALAIGMGVDIVGITTVAGNVGIDLATTNTLRVLSHLGASDVPVFRGSSRPLAASLHHAPYMHGDDGLAGAKVPPASAEEQVLTAPEAIVAMAEEFEGELTFVSVGPATNLAMALALRPGIVRHISRVVIMGGAYFTPGNRTPYAEFNAYIDPDALHQVYQADWNHIVGVGLDVTHRVMVSEALWNTIPTDGHAAQTLLRDVSNRAVHGRAKDPFYLHDPLAVAVAVDPSLVTTSAHAVEVESNDERRGHAAVSDGGTVEIATDVDVARFMQLFQDAFRIG